MVQLPGRTDAIRGTAALGVGLLAYAFAVVVGNYAPAGTQVTELLLDLLATVGLFGAPIVALYYWVDQPNSE